MGGAARKPESKPVVKKHGPLTDRRKSSPGSKLLGEAGGSPQLGPCPWALSGPWTGACPAEGEPGEGLAQALSGDLGGGGCLG